LRDRRGVSRPVPALFSPFPNHTSPYLSSRRHYAQAGVMVSNNRKTPTVKAIGYSVPHNRAPLAQATLTMTGFAHKSPNRIALLGRRVFCPTKSEKCPVHSLSPRFRVLFVLVRPFSSYCFLRVRGAQPSATSLIAPEAASLVSTLCTVASGFTYLSQSHPRLANLSRTSAAVIPLPFVFAVASIT
jgi:hypothetical protein